MSPQKIKSQETQTLKELAFSVPISNAPSARTALLKAQAPEIREIGVGELASVVHIVQSCHVSLGEELKAQLSWTPESLQEALERGKALGSFIQGSLVGFILFIEIGGETPSRGGEIWCLATHPQFQNQGVMSLLMDEVMRRFQEIWLEVHEDNKKAINFYKTKKFQQVGVRNKYYEDGQKAFLFSWNSEVLSPPKKGK